MQGGPWYETKAKNVVALHTKDAWDAVFLEGWGGGRRQGSMNLLLSVRCTPSSRRLP